MAALTLGLTTPRAAATPTATLEGMFMLPGQAARQLGGSLCPCEVVPYPNIPTLTNVGIGADSLSRWIAAAPTDEPLRILAYSQGSQAAMAYIRRNAGNPDLARLTFVLTGPPENPYQGNPRQGVGGTGFPSGHVNADVTMVIRQYDPVADAPADMTNFLALINTIMAFGTVHGNYNDIDLADPRNVRWQDPGSGVKYVYVPTEVLPILRWRDWFTSDEQMAELDDKYRPMIEAAYHRPVQIPDPTPPAVAEVRAPEPVLPTAGPALAAPAAVAAISKPDTDRRHTRKSTAPRTVGLRASASAATPRNAGTVSGPKHRAPLRGNKSKTAVSAASAATGAGDSDAGTDDKPGD